MSPATTFRRQCDRCGDIFFSPDRHAAVCPKCVKRYGLKKTSTPAAPPVRQPQATAPPRRLEPAHTRPAPPAKPKPLRPAVPPKPTVLTAEIRAAVTAAYRPYQDTEGFDLKEVHQKIAQELHLKRSMVAQVIQDLRPKGDPLGSLTEAQKGEIVALYRKYVTDMERPPGGRRRTIAKEMGLTLPQVFLALRAWARTVPSVQDLTREQLFAIEKSYWQKLRDKQGLREIIRAIAQETGFTEWQVNRWIDMLHNDATFAGTPDPAPETVSAIEQAYLRYLEGDGPPEQPLHQTIADRTGATGKEVHKVLLNLRRRLLQAASKT
ncbi:MAG: hypothetical protein IT210_22000 [Armatimonadetes bacterium]|nr:hypothetical protein [Armatimonadota bacterium]